MAQTQAEEFAEPAFSVNLGSAIIRKSVFERVGLFDETMRYSEDVDWFMRAREGGAAIVTIDAVTLLYRQHEQNMTRGKSTSELNVLKALKRSLDRRRERTGSASALPTFKTRRVIAEATSVALPLHVVRINHSDTRGTREMSRSGAND